MGNSFERGRKADGIGWTRCERPFIFWLLACCLCDRRGGRRRHHLGLGKRNPASLMQFAFQLGDYHFCCCCFLLPSLIFTHSAVSHIFVPVRRAVPAFVLLAAQPAEITKSGGAKQAECERDRPISNTCSIYWSLLVGTHRERFPRLNQL